MDPAKGIDREMAPRLFTKFATKSETGIIDMQYHGR